jgi:hypothetical protein
MPLSSLSALIAAVSVSALMSASDASAQSRAINSTRAQSVASVTIIDGISLGIRKSHQGESELWIEANDLKATVMTRSEGKLFRIIDDRKDQSTGSQPTQEIAVAFE